MGQDQRAVWGPGALGTWGQDGRGGNVDRHQLDKNDSIYQSTYPDRILHPSQYSGLYSG